MRLRVETDGSFDDRDQVYQAFFPLPKIGGYHVQVSTFTAAHRYGGACVRVDKSPVITMISDNMPLRAVRDADLLEMETEAFVDSETELGGL